jgi:hypothetical protein
MQSSHQLLLLLLPHPAASLLPSPATFDLTSPLTPSHQLLLLLLLNHHHRHRLVFGC